MSSGLGFRVAWFQSFKLTRTNMTTKPSLDAIVVTGKGKVKGKDALFKLMYLASTSTKEADGMIISHKKDLVLRVFQTENYNHVH
jgi:hypothetical protein